jgi:hypothetical protein
MLDWLLARFAHSPAAQYCDGRELALLLAVFAMQGEGCDAKPVKES